MLLDCPAAGTASLRSPIKKPLAPQKQGPAHKPASALLSGETLQMRAPLSQDTVKFSGWKNQGVLDNARYGNSLLVRWGINLNSPVFGKDAMLHDPDDDGNTPLHLAAEHGHFKTVRELLKEGANPNIQNNEGDTPLHHAAESIDPEKIVRLLLENKANPNIQNNEGETPLYKAAEIGYLGAAQALLEYGADPSIKDEDDEEGHGGKTPLHIAANRGYFEIAQALLAHGADPNLEDSRGGVPLHSAAHAGYQKTTETLLAHGADPNVRSEGSPPSLHLAALGGYLTIVQVLLAKGADPFLKSTVGETARMWAEKRGYTEIAAMLKAAEEAQKAKAGSSSFAGGGHTLSAARNALQTGEDFEGCWTSLQQIYQSNRQQLFPDLLELAKERDLTVATHSVMEILTHPELHNGDNRVPDLIVTEFLKSEDAKRQAMALMLAANFPELSGGKYKSTFISTLKEFLHDPGKASVALYAMASASQFREGKNEKLFTSKLNEFLKSDDTEKIETALKCLLETDCPSGNLDYSAMLRDSFDWPNELREKAREVWEKRKDSEGKALVSTSSHSASGKSSPVRSVASSSSVTAEEEEERSPSEVVMEHFRRKKPLSEYSGDLSALLGNQSAVDYLAQHLKENLTLDPKGKQPEGRTLKTQARLAEQYKEDTPENIRAFWDQACRQGIGQTVPQALGLATPQKGLDSIAGMVNLKKKLTSQFINPFWWQKNPDRFRRPDGTLPNVKPPKLNGGLLLYGPEGTGKSFIAEKLSEEMDRPHIKLLPSNVFSKWVGESEKAVQAAFDQATKSKPPAFVIIDEIDSFLSKKDDMTHQTDMKVINELMQQLEDAPKKDVTVIGTTNHIDKLEQAAVRDGRFAVRLEVPPPDRASRLAMWNMFLKDTTADGSLPFTDKERGQLADMTRGYSTARIKNLVGQAANQSLEELKDLDLDILKQLIRETGPSYDEQRMQRYHDVD